MQELDLVISKRKGEALLNFRNDAFEGVMLVFHANTISPGAQTLHFGIKPGHLFLFRKRRRQDEGQWLLKDAGYLNYFRADKPYIELTHYNTLAKQKLFAKGLLRAEQEPGRVRLTSWSTFPLHRRRVTFRYDDERAEVEVDDYYLGRCRVYWNFEDHLEDPRGWFHQTRVLAL